METEIFKQVCPEVLSLPTIKTKTGTIKAGMSTRIGGFSRAPYAKLNFGYHVGDDPALVTENRQRFGDRIGIAPDKWIAGEQVHGNQVKSVSQVDRGRGALDYESAISGVDGLLTNETDCLLTACFADCTPIFFWSEKCSAVGLAHAGWKGTVSEIASEMIQRFRQDYGILAEDISAAIGPSIGQCCYEVDDQVVNRIKDISGISFQDVIIPKDNGHYMLNLQRLNKLILLKNGIFPENIFTTTLCTSCRTDIFFSHRKEGGPTGRMMGYIGIISGD